MDTMTETRPQLVHLTAQIDELKQRGTYFHLRVLEDEQGPVCTPMTAGGSKSRIRTIMTSEYSRELIDDCA